MFQCRPDNSAVTWRLRVDKDLLLHSFTGIPSIFAFMSFLLLLMAERTASRRKPGHLSSLRISLHKHIHEKPSVNRSKSRCMYINASPDFFQDETRDINTHADTSTHTPAHPPLVIVELLLHQEQVGFELVPLENDVTHLLLGEARLVGILVVVRQLVRRLASFLMRTRLRGETNTKSHQAQTGPERVSFSALEFHPSHRPT